MKKYNLRELLNIDDIQNMFSDFHVATGFSVGMIAVDGEILVNSGWQDICTKFHRVQTDCLQNCRKSDAIIQEHLEVENFYDYKCLNGLVDAAIPVIIGGEHLASVFFGQFFYDDDVGTEEEFRERAKKFGFDEDEYIEAYKKIPAYSREQVKKVMNFCKTVVGMITESGSKNLMLAEELKREKEFEKKLALEKSRYRSLVETTTDHIITLDRNGRYLYINGKAAEELGRKPEDIIGKTMHDLYGAERACHQLESIRKVIDNEKSIISESYVSIHDDDKFFLINIHPVSDENGKVAFAQLVARDVTELRNTQDQLEVQRSFLDSIYNGTDVSIFVMDVSDSGEFIYRGLNKTHEKTSGFKSEQLEGKTPDELIDMMPKEAIEEVKRHYQDCVDAGETIHYEEMIPMLGKEIWWYTTLTPLYNKEGRIYRIIGSAICINELKETQNELEKHKQNLEEMVSQQTEELMVSNEELRKEVELKENLTLELKQREEQYRRIFESVTNAIFIIDENGMIVETNPSASETYGYTKEEFLNLPVAKLIREDYHSELERFTETVKAGEVFHGQTIDIRKFGEELHSIVTGRRIMFRGKPHFMAVISDLTELKQAQKEVDRFFEVTLSLLCIANTEGYFTKLNPSWKQLLGYDEETLLKHRFIDFIHPDDVELTEKEVEKLSQGKITLNFTNRYRCKDGSYKWLNWNTIPKGNVLYASAVDVTKLKETEQKINEIMEDLKSSNLELEQFAYVASHDLQEPLRKISSFTELITQRYADKIDDRGRRYMDYIIDGAQRMQKQITGLLEFSRISTRGKPFEPVDMSAVMRHVIANLDLQISHKNAEVEYDLLPEIMADETQMLSLMQNLTGNALKFCKDKMPKILIKYEDKENEWLFSVKDNGIGIDEESKERVFMIFQRLHDRSEYPGTGIGLAMCKKIVERHGGKIWLESVPGEGTTFYFSISKRLK